MDRYAETFRKLKAEGRKAFIPFAVLGDPDLSTSLSIIRTYLKSGADILELGLPFSDPIADGPVNQRAAQRALSRGLTTPQMFGIIARVRRETEVPIGLLCYCNTVHQFGIDKFFRAACQSGADSVLVADSPVETSGDLCRAAAAAGVKTVFIVSELSDAKRIRKIAQKTTAFIYLVSRLGVTGSQAVLSQSIAGSVKAIRRQTRLPVCVGFGVSTPGQVAALSRLAINGIICGSAIVQKIEKNLGQKKRLISRVGAYVRQMARATRV